MSGPSAHVADGVEAMVSELLSKSDSSWAWANYANTIRRLIALSGARSVIEIGGGRAPTFSHAEVLALGLEYTSNDISERELNKAPRWVGRALFDVQGEDLRTIAPFEDGFDIAFSRMVMEHVEDHERAYANIYRLLRPGGISLAFHPVLFAVPFVINKALPEKLSAHILRAVFPNRTDEGTPKFPAFYSGCTISKRLRTRLERIGFTRVWQVPFYGHGYYKKLPFIRELHKRTTTLIRNYQVSALASYTFTIAVK